MQIDLALQRHEVYNLKKTWSYVGSYEKGILQSVRSFTTPVKNFKQIRDTMENTQGLPSVPFLGSFRSFFFFVCLFVCFLN